MLGFKDRIGVEQMLNEARATNWVVNLLFAIERGAFDVEILLEGGDKLDKVVS
jgi:hypothetical protein